MKSYWPQSHQATHSRDGSKHTLKLKAVQPRAQRNPQPSWSTRTASDRRDAWSPSGSTVIRAKRRCLLCHASEDARLAVDVAIKPLPQRRRLRVIVGRLGGILGG